MGDQVNNWKAAEELQRFKDMYLDPAIKKFEDAEKIMNDPGTKMSADVKKRSQEKLKRLEGEMINLKRLYSAVKELIDQHESQTDLLTEIYAEWFNTVAMEGMQPLEIMKMQQDIIQKIWAKIYIAIQPLNLDLKPPKSLTDG